MTEGTKALPKLSTQLAKTLSHRNFDPEKFARSVSAQSDGDKDLIENQQRIQALGESTAQILKQQVYQNYQLFINTAKEISFLEGEMFQLNHILTEQKNLMEEMTKIFVSKTKEEVVPEDEEKKKAADDEQDKRKVMAALVGKIEGCSLRRSQDPHTSLSPCYQFSSEERHHLWFATRVAESENILETPGRYLVHDADVIELDPDTFATKAKIHIFLFNDCVMVTTAAPTRRGPAVSGKYKFQVLWEIDTLAMVNARDVGRKRIPARTKEGYPNFLDGPAVKNAFKVLCFPDTRMFQCESAKEKREWLDVVEETKRKHLTEKEKKSDLTSPTTPNAPSINPFSEIEHALSEAVKPDRRSPANQRKPSPFFDERLNADWLQEMPEDLDVFIAQRSFEQAVDVVLKSQQYLADIADCPQKDDFVTKLSNRIDQLIEVLSRELRSTPDRSLRGGPRIIRRPVLLLIKLGQSSKACDLFLANRSGAVTFAMRQLRTEGSLSLYIGKLCKVFFSNLEETAREFDMSFGEVPGCYSSFAIWCQTELQGFVDTFSQQVFGRSAADIGDVAECVRNAHNHCRKLRDLGLDLDFLLDQLLLDHIKSLVRDHKQKIIDANKLRNSEELWRSTNMGTPKATEKMLEELTSLGLDSTKIGAYCREKCFLSLTGSTIAFTRAVLNHVDSVMKMLLPELEKAIVDGIAEIVTSYTDFVSGCLRSETERKEKAELIRANAAFLSELLLPLVRCKVKKNTSQTPKKLLAVIEDFAQEISS